MAKFADIPKFTQRPPYAVHMSIKYMCETLEDYKDRHNLDMNPDFQRAHVWNDEQRIKFMEYMLRGGVSGLDIYFNHPTWMGSFVGDLVLVDGKQRLEAARKFVQNELPAFGHYYRDYTDKLSITHCNFVFHINNLKTRVEILN